MGYKLSTWNITSRETTLLFLVITQKFHDFILIKNFIMHTFKKDLSCQFLFLRHSITEEGIIIRIAAIIIFKSNIVEELSIQIILLLFPQLLISLFIIFEDLFL
jgi:hypothetical protein